jgi:4-diphosphocytidyl-2-C-methyl-D-erythritol kinase
LVNPNIHIDTSWAFTKIEIEPSQKPVKEIIAQPIETWKHQLANDFEKPVFENYPEIKKIKETLYHIGAIYASLSGSGSSVYGIFNEVDTINAEFPAKYFTRVINFLK